MDKFLSQSVFIKNINHITFFNIDYKKYLLCIKSELFDTEDNGAMMLKIQLWHHKNCILKRNRKLETRKQIPVSKPFFWTVLYIYKICQNRSVDKNWIKFQLLIFTIYSHFTLLRIKVSVS